MRLRLIFLKMFGFFKKNKSAKSSEDRIASILTGDETLMTYQQMAQEQMPYLIDFMTGHSDGVEEYGEVLFRYAVKTNFEENGHSEHMWVQVHDFDNDCFTGTLANEPSTMKLLKHGDPVKVLRNDVEDWILQDLLTGTKVGGFSSNYIRNKAKKNNYADRNIKRYGRDCTEQHGLYPV